MDYTITKAITKMPNDYPDKQNQPHVQVALRMIERGIPVRPGNEIPYIITKNESVKSYAQRARHPDNMEGFEVDLLWYKQTQIHPPVLRLCAPIAGTDSAHLAECLGLDAARYLLIKIIEFNFF